MSIDIFRQEFQTSIRNVVSVKNDKVGIFDVQYNFSLDKKLK